MTSQAARRHYFVAVAVVALGAAYVAIGLLWRYTDSPNSIVAYDFYGQFYPWQIHVRRALTAGGLFWNPYQDCGQPFFANIQTALLYPVNLVFLLLPREPALIVCVFLNLVIAGVGMFALCRAIGTSDAAALGGALSYQLSLVVITLASWSPTHIGTLVWMPVALWRCERLVREPTLRQGIALGVVLALQILAGFPQIVVFTYQLIALRLAWALLFRQTRAGPLLWVAALALLSPPLLAAVQLLPSLEVVRDSLWGAPLKPEEIGQHIGLGLGIASHFSVAGYRLLLVMGCVAALGLRRSPLKIYIAFYLFVAVLYFLLSLGPGSPFFRLYELLPLAGAFRGSGRLLWASSLAVTVLVALAIDELIARGGAREARWSTIATIGIVASAAVMHIVATRGFTVADWVVTILLAAMAGVARWPVARRWLPIALPTLIVANAIAADQPVFTQRSGDVYAAHMSVIDDVRDRLTPQDRILIVSTHPDLGLMPKSGTVFALPNVHDYDPMASRAYAEFFTFLRTGRAYRNMEDWYWLFGKLLQPGLQRPLLDLTAARYLVVDTQLDRTAETIGDLRMLRDDGNVRLYENAGALARARYVARLRIVPADQVLPRLVDGTVDARTSAVSDHAPQSGFTGTEGDATGTVEIVGDDPERVALRAHATAPGFLFLADAYAPGWRVRVNGTTREIVRANHTFRLVEIPSGNSEVVFTYQPSSVRLGAAVTLTTVIAVAGLWRRAGAVRV